MKRIYDTFYTQLETELRNLGVNADNYIIPLRNIFNHNPRLRLGKNVKALSIACYFDNVIGNDFSKFMEIYNSREFPFRPQIIFRYYVWFEMINDAEVPEFFQELRENWFYPEIPTREEEEE